VPMQLGGPQFRWVVDVKCEVVRQSFTGATQPCFSSMFRLGYIGYEGFGAGIEVRCKRVLVSASLCGRQGGQPTVAAHCGPQNMSYKAERLDRVASY
jgi:hypothetical protein